MADPTVQPEGSFEIGKDEAWATNLKLLVDGFIQDHFECIKENRVHFNKLVSDAQQNTEALRAASLIALQNAISTSDLVAKNAVSQQDALNKQHLAHRDIATNKTWNLEPSEGAAEAVTMRSITLDDTSLKAIGAAVAAAVANAINPPKPAPSA